MSMAQVRLKISLFHLALSVAIASTIIFYIRCILYPSYFFSLSGGGKLSFMIVVAAIIGPLLTLIIYNKTKGRKKLIFDLTVIMLLQMIILSYALHLIWLVRPVYNVFVIDRFVIVRNIDLKPDKLEKALPPYNKLPGIKGPDLVAVRKPSSPDEQLKIILSGAEGYDLELFPEYYISYEEQKKEIMKKSLPIIQLKRKSGIAVQEIEQFLKKEKGKIDDYYYLPVKGFEKKFMSIVLKKNGDIVSVLPIDPW